jgi:hypothetical protein
MKWKVPLFSIIFIISIACMFWFLNKPLIVYSKTVIEEVQLPAGSLTKEPVTKTYQENYGSIGAVIGFGILAGASIVSIAISVKTVNGNKI